MNTYYVTPEVSRMKTFQSNVKAIERNLQSKDQRIHELETALNRMICAHENTQADTDGRWPQPDMGCVICTVGTVPNALNTGLCARHNAMKLLGQL